jgi:hypothetical protein
MPTRKMRSQHNIRRRHIIIRKVRGGIRNMGATRIMKGKNAEQTLICEVGGGSDGEGGEEGGGEEGGGQKGGGLESMGCVGVGSTIMGGIGEGALGTEGGVSGKERNEISSTDKVKEEGLDRRDKTHKKSHHGKSASDNQHCPNTNNSCAYHYIQERHTQ